MSTLALLAEAARGMKGTDDDDDLEESSDDTYEESGSSLSSDDDSDVHFSVAERKQQNVQRRRKSMLVDDDVGTAAASHTHLLEHCSVLGRTFLSDDAVFDLFRPLEIPKEKWEREQEEKHQRQMALLQVDPAEVARQREADAKALEEHSTRQKEQQQRQKQETDENEDEPQGGTILQSSLAAWKRYQARDEDIAKEIQDRRRGGGDGFIERSEFLQRASNREEEKRLEELSKAKRRKI
eukprot:PhM_4_TR12883/c0_g1_i1/m.36462